MSPVTDHIATAIDQLRIADDLCTVRNEQIAFVLTAAQVHAQIAIAEAIREYAGWTLPDLNVSDRDE